MSQISHKPEKRGKAREREGRKKKWGSEGMRQVPLILNACKRSSDSHPWLSFTHKASLKTFFNRQLTTWWSDTSLRLWSPTWVMILQCSWFQTAGYFSSTAHESHSQPVILVFGVMSYLRFFSSYLKPTLRQLQTTVLSSLTPFFLTRIH